MIVYSLEASGNATRHNFSAKISEQDLHETFVPAFQQCVLNGRPAQIMVRVRTPLGREIAEI